MSDLNRGIMKFDGADKPVLVAVSAVLIFGGIIALVVWALNSAYAVQLCLIWSVRKYGSELNCKINFYLAIYSGYPML